MTELKSQLEQIEDKKTKFGYPASDIDRMQLKDYLIPSMVLDEIPTLNQYGFMKVDIDKYSQHFIDYASSAAAPCLEIGTAYGLVTVSALEAGATIIANDLSYEHLTVLLKNAPENSLDRLYLYPGALPDEIEMEDGSLGAVMASRVMHFLDASMIEKSLNKIHRWLERDGKFYSIAVTPNYITLKDGFLEEYNRRVKNNESWPGIIDNQWLINPGHKEYVPPFLHVFDVYQLEKLLPKFGFEIEDISHFDYPDDRNTDNLGHVGVRARKVNLNNAVE